MYTLFIVALFVAQACVSEGEFTFPHFTYKKKAGNLRAYNIVEGECSQKCSVESGSLEHKRCTRLCASPSCYEILYASDELEQGEIDDMNDDTKNAIDGLIPALVQSFGVIILGYLAGRWQLLSESQGQGLNSYVTKFALPSVFFKVMVSIDFSDVCWNFVAAVSLSKLIAFVLAFVITLLLSRNSQLGKAAILSMFSSQSNDVALGYPVLNALYGDLASYVYLFAPVQLVILNPISYMFLEWHAMKKPEQEMNKTSGSNNPAPAPVSTRGQCRRLLQVIWRVMLNPIFFMTVIGVVFNFILNHHIPVYVNGLLNVVADSFAATALFTLGFGMVGKMGRITKHDVNILVAILMLKLVILPFITREMVVQLMPREKINETLRYSTFGFLYGAIPTAPPVYLFAAQYQILPNVVGVGLVVGTFLCAPMMFILARMVTMYMADPDEYDALLGSAVTSVSWVSIGCVLWTVVILFLSRKAFRLPHRFTLCYLFCVLLSCIGVVVGHFLEKKVFTTEQHLLDRQGYWTKPATWYHYVQFIIFFVGCTGARLWTILIALSMYLLRSRGLCYLLRNQFWIYIIGFVTPSIITSILLLASTRQAAHDLNPAIQYGQGQLITSLVVLLTSTFGTLIFTICYLRLDPSVPHSAHIQSDDDDTAASERAALCPHIRYDENSPTETDNLSTEHNHAPAPSIDSNLCRCSSDEVMRSCHRSIARYEQLCTGQTTPMTYPLAADGVNTAFDRDDEFQHQRHLILIFVLLITMFFGVCLCTWRLVKEAPSGLYLVLEFIDGTFNFGQGVLLFIIFGLDAELIIVPVKRSCSRVLRKCLSSMFAFSSSDLAIIVPVTLAEPDLNADHVVHQFVTYHLVSCANSIAHRNEDPTSMNQQVFTDASLQQWLTHAGLVRSEEEAITYCQTLQHARVIERVAPSSREDLETMTDENEVNLLCFRQ